MGIDVNASLIKHEPITGLHHTYGHEVDYNLMACIQDCLVTEDTTFDACAEDLVDAIKYAKDHDMHIEVVQFFEQCLARLVACKDYASVLINISY